MYSSLCKASSKFEFKLFWIGSDRIKFTADKLLTTREIMKGFHQKRTEKKATRTSYHGEEKCNQQTNVTLVSLRELDERKDERNTLTVAILVAWGKTKLPVWCLNLYFIFILQIIVDFFPFMNCSCFRTELRLWLIQMPYGTSIRESKFPFFQYYSIDLQCRVMCYLFSILLSVIFFRFFSQIAQEQQQIQPFGQLSGVSWSFDLSILLPPSVWKWQNSSLMTL